MTQSGQKLQKQECYAAIADEEIRSVSSSGGAFTVLAGEILDRGGLVCGAAFDANFQCVMKCVSNKEGLEALRGSKYVKAKMSQEIVAEMRNALRAGKPVLLCATPCLVAAANSMLKDCGELFYGVDLVCAGCPEQWLFDRYLDESLGRANVAKYEFRSKARGWRHHHYLLHVVLKSGEEIWREKGEDEYMTVMSTGIGVSEGCFRCPFKNMNRPGDVTIGDFWKVPAEMDDAKGTSAVMLNTEKGRILFDSVRDRFTRLKEYPPSFLEACQPALRTQRTPHACRGAFLGMLGSATVKEAVKRATTDLDRNVAILNFHWETANTGAVLTAYALNRGLREMGFVARNIDFKTDLPRVARKPSNPKLDAFRAKHIPSTHQISDAAALKGLDSQFGSYVTGSDQVWNPRITGWYRDAYFLSFAGPGKRLVSGAASFGVDPVESYGSKSLGAMLGAFDGLGVREKSATDKLALAGIHARTVADPVFLLDREQWLELASQAENEPCARGDIVWYAVNSFGKREIAGYFGRNARLLVRAPRRIDAFDGVEQWLAAISSASLVVTDSFHAVCMAVMFERPFAVLARDDAKSGRIRDFLSSVGLSDRVFLSERDMPSVKELAKSPDFTQARSKIAAMRNELAEYLKESLSRPVFVDARRVEARKAALAALEKSARASTWALRRAIAVAILKTGVKLLLGRNIRRNIDGIAAANAEYEGWRKATARLRGYIGRLAAWKE